MFDNKVFLYCDERASYPDGSYQFRPSDVYPENPFPEFVAEKTNSAYAAVRAALVGLGLDKEHYGSAVWNPLGVYITPGDKVVVKPNLVLDKNYRVGYACETDCVYTNPAVTAAVIDYVIIALKGQGNIIVGDAPVQECNFDWLIQNSGYKKLISFYQERGILIELKDFRGLISENRHGVLHQQINEKAQGVVVHLDTDSEFAYQENQDVRITNYNPNELKKHHHGIYHEYYVAKDILDADVVINVPKPKTHRKAGLTGCLKNLVGINCRKEYLPHHTYGGNNMWGGDEYRSVSKIKQVRSYIHDRFCYAVADKRYVLARLYQAINIILDAIVLYFFNDKTSWGSWYGNNTISKTIIDLNRILIYADRNGLLHTEPQRKEFSVCDMIVSGEHNGPMAPDSKFCGIILAGENSYFIDTVIATIMGINITKLPTFLQAQKSVSRLVVYSKKDDAIILSNDTRYDNKKCVDIQKEGIMHFVPPQDWEEVFK